MPIDQISMEITDSYLFSLPFTGGSGMNRSLLQGVAVMGIGRRCLCSDRHPPQKEEPQLILHTNSKESKIR